MPDSMQLESVHPGKRMRTIRMRWTLFQSAASSLIGSSSGGAMVKEGGSRHGCSALTSTSGTLWTALTFAVIRDGGQHVYLP